MIILTCVGKRYCFYLFKPISQTVSEISPSHNLVESATDFIHNSKADFSEINSDTQSIQNYHFMY